MPIWPKPDQLIDTRDAAKAFAICVGMRNAHGLIDDCRREIAALGQHLFQRVKQLVIAEMPGKSVDAAMAGISRLILGHFGISRQNVGSRETAKTPAIGIDAGNPRTPVDNVLRQMAVVAGEVPQCCEHLLLRHVVGLSVIATPLGWLMASHDLLGGIE
jgi:hypothetical protein